MLSTLSSAQLFVIALLALIFGFVLLMRSLAIIGNHVHVEVEVDDADDDPAPSTGKTAIQPKVEQPPPLAKEAKEAKEVEQPDPTDWQEELLKGVREALREALPFASRALAARILTLCAADIWFVVYNQDIATEFASDVAELDLDTPAGYGATSVMHVTDGKMADYQAAIRVAVEYAEALAMSAKWPDGEVEDFELMPELLDAATKTPDPVVS